MNYNQSYKIFITGRPGVGKTTLIKNVIKRIKYKAGGFYTEEIREGGKRKGFKIITLDGEEEILAHMNFKTPYKVGKYSVNLEALNNIGIMALKKALKYSEIIIIDEIGPMELKSKEFKKIILEILDSSKNALATIKLKGNSFVEKIKKRNDIKFILLDNNNANYVYEKLLKYFC